MIPAIKANYDYRIDAIRAIACALVAIVHFSVPTWTSPIILSNYYIDKILFSIINTGWIGVPIFLFISGYSLALNKVINSNVKINFSQYFKNRFLRIFPLWALCITILIISHKISGQNVISMALFQLQDIPPSTAFNIAWSLQLEVACYFLFPIFFVAIQKNDTKQIAIFFVFFIIMRLWVIYSPANALFVWSYGSIFGGGTLFLAGMCAARISPIKFGVKSIALFFLGITGILLFCTLMWINGGYQNPSGIFAKFLIVFIPEIMAICMTFVVIGYLTKNRKDYKKINIFYKLFCYFGTISYSAYLLSLFNNDLASRVFSFIKPTGWISLIEYSFGYFLMLIILASISYYAIEKPFLDFRKSDIELR